MILGPRKCYRIVKLFVRMRLLGKRGELRLLFTETAMLFPKSLSKPVCEELVGIIDEVCDMPEHPRRSSDKLGSDTRIWGFEADIPELVNRFDIERWLHAIEMYNGEKLRAWCLMANRVVPRKGNLGSGGGDAQGLAVAA